MYLIVKKLKNVNFIIGKSQFFEDIAVDKVFVSNRPSSSDENCNIVNNNASSSEKKMINTLLALKLDYCV